jgi:hypothetical protein
MGKPEIINWCMLNQNLHDYYIVMDDVKLMIFLRSGLETI